MEAEASVFLSLAFYPPVLLGTPFRLHGRSTQRQLHLKFSRLRVHRIPPRPHPPNFVTSLGTFAAMDTRTNAAPPSSRWALNHRSLQPR
ncbi:hypothetical protein EDB83DRAFT_2367589 [Lactarius deliciosus]|nr:hypothetical protein EDB83DRAFT_2367589 [Lactarius deliciosus]